MHGSRPGVGEEEEPSVWELMERMELGKEEVAYWRGVSREG